MSAVVAEIVQPASIFFATALTLSGVFCHLSPSRFQRLAVGVTCGLGCVALIVLTPGLSNIAKGVGPMILVGSFVSGLDGVAGVLLPALAALLWEGGTAAYPSVAGAVLLALAGLGARVVHQRLKVPLHRPTIAGLALLTPIGLIGTALPPYQAIDAASLWLPIGTLIFGFAVTVEHARGNAFRAKNAEVRFCAVTDTVTPQLFKSQLEQQFRMHQRYGHEYGYMLISIDDAAALRKRLPAAEWERIRTAVASTMRRAVREPDVCAAVDFDRFAVILPHASLPFALPVAGRVQRAVAETMAARGLDVTVSVGVAEVDGTQAAPEIEAAAEAELFLANMRQPKAAIGPWMDWPAAAPRSLASAAEDGPPPGERRLRTTRLVSLADADTFAV